MKHWIFIAFAIFLEGFGTISMKLSHGFTKPIPSLSMFFCYGLSFLLVSIAVRKIDISVAYAIWAGGGTALIAVIGFFYFGDKITLIKLFSISLIILGVIGLNFQQAPH